MQTKLISRSGEFPDITWAVDSFYVTWQLGSDVIVEQRDPNLEFLKSWSIPIKGSAGAFPRIYYHNLIHVGYRLGAENYTGYVHPLGEPRPNFGSGYLGVIHGVLPLVFGPEGYAFIVGSSKESYPVSVMTWEGKLTRNVRNAQGTGLSRLDPSLKVTIVDEDRSVIPGLFDPAWAGPCVVGATDRDGHKCIVAKLPDGRECELWKGEDSPNPRICTDGVNFYVVVWSGEGFGIRLAKFTQADFKFPVVKYPRTPQDLPKQLKKKYVGNWFSTGRYGDYSAKQNTAIIAAGLYKDGDGKFPNDLIPRMQREADKYDRLYIGDDTTTIRAMIPFWGKVIAVFVHEVGKPEQVRAACTAAKLYIKTLGLPPRPISSVLTEDDSTDSSFRGTSDLPCCEIYFQFPASSYVEMERLVSERIQQCLEANSGPIIITVQAYDRDREAWKKNTGMIQAIIFACASAMAENDRIIGLFFFALSRPGGLLTHPELRPWAEHVFELTPGTPEVPIISKPQKPEEKPMALPGQAELEDFMIFLHEVCYMQELQRKGGLFESPNPQTDRITDARFPKGERVMDSAAFRWIGEYNQKYQDNLATPGGPHEAAKKAVRAIIHDSDEARRKRGEDPQ